MRAMLLVVPLLLATGPLPATSSALILEPVEGGIQPGDGLLDGPSATFTFCTLNFVFDGLGTKVGKVYIGTAGHCVSQGEVVHTHGFPSFGTVVYDNDGELVDFALIEIASGFHANVLADVRGHPGLPTGTTTSATTQTGDLLLLSGYGLGWEVTPTTRERRVGALLSDNPTRYRADTLAVFGDSGGPVLHAGTGRALGVISAFSFFAIPPATDAGPTIEGLLPVLAQAGFPVALRTAAPPA